MAPSLGKGTTAASRLMCWLLHCRGSSSPAPGTPGEGWGGGCVEQAPLATSPHRNPPPEYRRREQVRHHDYHALRHFLNLRPAFRTHISYDSLLMRVQFTSILVLAVCLG